MRNSFGSDPVSARAYVTPTNSNPRLEDVRFSGVSEEDLKL
jgi:hypothetical protein